MATGHLVPTPSLMKLQIATSAKTNPNIQVQMANICQKCETANTHTKKTQNTRGPARKFKYIYIYIYL